MPLSQDAQQILSSEIYDDSLDISQALSAVSLRQDLNYIRSILRAVIDPTGTWFSTPAANLATLSTDVTASNAHLLDASIHFTEASIDHANILNVGTNTHAQIDAHIANTSNPHGTTPASIGAAPLAHTHVSTDITDFTAATDGVIGANPLVAANTAKVSADGSISTHFDVDTQGANTPNVGEILFWDGMCWRPTTPGAGGFVPLGDVSGPGLGSATDNAIVRWDGTTGQLIQDSSVLVGDLTGGVATIQGGTGIALALQSDIGQSLYLRHADGSTALEITPTPGSSLVFHDLVRSPTGQDLIFNPDQELVINGPALVNGILSVDTGLPSASVPIDPARNQIFMNTDTGEISVRKDTGLIVSLEGGGTGSNLLQEGLSTPLPTPGFTQLFMSGVNEVNAVKGNGDIVNLELGGGLQLAFETVTPSGGQTVFNLSDVPSGEIFMFVNGIELNPGVEFTHASGVITFDPIAAQFAMAATDTVDFYYEVGIPPAVGPDAVTVAFDCTATEQVGDLVYISAANTVSQADASSLASSGAIGWIVSKPNATSCLVSTGAGPVSASGLTPGGRVYLSDSTPGGVTTTEPSSPSVSVEVGFAKNSSEFIFQAPEILA